MYHRSSGGEELNSSQSAKAQPQLSTSQGKASDKLVKYIIIIVFFLSFSIWFHYIVNLIPWMEFYHQSLDKSSRSYFALRPEDLSSLKSYTSTQGEYLASVGVDDYYNVSILPPADISNELLRFYEAHSKHYSYSSPDHELHMQKLEMKLKEKLQKKLSKWKGEKKNEEEEDESEDEHEDDEEEERLEKELENDLKLFVEIDKIKGWMFKDYPHYFPLGELLTQWPANNTDSKRWKSSQAHSTKSHGLYRINYANEDERGIAYVMRDLGLPYVVYNLPALNSAATNSFTLSNLMQKFGSMPRVVEKSRSEEFLYYTLRNPLAVARKFPSWSAPQQDLIMSFSQFLYEANLAEQQSMDESQGKGLYYLIISAAEGGRTDWIRNTLLEFSPSQKSLFIQDPDDARGINCRFGMKGVIATAHYDSKTNYIEMVRGRKRYVLLPPTECNKLELYPKGHPSARHSQGLWSNTDELRSKPELFNSKATEVVVSMGEALYIPSFWFHYIISQDSSIQCNARSGESDRWKDAIAECGFRRSRKGNGEKEGSTSGDGKKSKTKLKGNEKLRKRHVEWTLEN